MTIVPAAAVGRIHSSLSPTCCANPCTAGWRVMKTSTMQGGSVDLEKVENHFEG